MADTVDTGLLPRTYFKAPRVPFDFRALALAMLGYLVFWGGSLLLNTMFDKPFVVGSFLSAAGRLFEDIPFLQQVVPDFLGNVFLGRSLARIDFSSYTFWHQLVGGVWIFLVWSFFAQAIHRISALRIARDEGLSFGEAFRFAASNWITVLLAPVIITLTIAFFYGCNALAGLAMSIPWLGQVFGIILVPLTLIATLLILLISLGGILGLPLIGAAAAWERNGTLDAISRAFSYIFARPLQFFWSYFLIFLLVGVILLVGSWFTFTLVKSVDAGVVSDRLTVLLDAPQRIENAAVPAEETAFADLSPEAQADLRRYDDAHRASLSADATGLMAAGDGQRGPRARTYARRFETVTTTPGAHVVNAFVFWLAIKLIWLGIFGYAIFWFIGATTSVYADLRADVDGTEEDEIYLEEEDEDFDALAEAAANATPESAPPPPEAPETPPAPEAGDLKPEGDDTPAS